jgi:HD-GYP domain-containing protein (c-di-GMP phosphodiesterase class II)
MQPLRLAELLAGLSLVADAGMGLEPGEAGRAALVAVELAALAGAPDPRDVYYTALLQHVGCTAYAHEAARLLGGDDLAVKRASVHTDFARPRDVVRTYLPNLAPSARLATRVAAAGTAAVRSREIVRGYSRANCEVAARTAERIARGPGVALPARIVQVAATAALFHGLGGRAGAVEAIRRRAGRALDPGLVALLAARDGAALGVLESVADPVRAAVDAEPPPAAAFESPQALDRICRAFGEVVDIKTPLHHGHCTGVAALAGAAAKRAGLAAAEVRRAALVHDLGRAAVPNGVWERDGPLTWAEQEGVRLHAYHSERVLVRCGPLAPVARLAGMHHERLDGSGYHRGAPAATLAPSERLLAAADVLHALTEHRAHRPARTAEDAAAVLAAEAVAGRLDPDAVRAVIEAAGGSAERVRAPRPAGLTERQVEVLRLVARGCRTPRSRAGSSSRAARPSTTSRTSTRASASRAAPPPRSSRSSTTCCPRMGRSADAPGPAAARWWRPWNPPPSSVASSTSTRPARASAPSPSSCTPTSSTTAARRGSRPAPTACASSSTASAPPSTASAPRSSTRSHRATRS